MKPHLLAWFVPAALALGVIGVANTCRMTGTTAPTAMAPSATPAAVTSGAGASSSALLARVDVAEKEVLSGHYHEASEHIDAVFQELGASPSAELEASAHYVRGLCRSELGEYELAIVDLDVARKLDRANGNAGSYLHDTVALGAAYDYANRLPEGEALFREVVEMAAEGSREQGRALVDLGVNLDMQHRCDEATTRLDRAVSLLERVAPREPALDDAYNSLGNCAYEAHRLEKAKTYYGRALELRKASLGSQNPRIGIMEHNLAVTLAELGLRDEALVHVRTAVAIRENTLPPDHHWRRESEALLAELVGLAPGTRRLRH